MVESQAVTTVLQLLISPIGPALVLLAGAAIEVFAGRWLRRPGWLTAMALSFAGCAALFFVALQFQGVVPTFSRPWQPLLQSATNLVPRGSPVGHDGVVPPAALERLTGSRGPQWADLVRYGVTPHHVGGNRH